MIDPGKDHIFDIPLQGRLVKPLRQGDSTVMEFRVIVALQTGKSYFYTFERPLR